jgi:anaerobic selenocysteine-containing dehydrogenase/Fe-S-cluster-containing dehydrogenase component
MAELGRRDFLKIAGLAGTSAAVGGCSDPTRLLIPYLIPPEDIIPGDSTFYATTCRECPAGCGLLAKNRDGRIIKVEGNPLHPVNGGKLCARGQASLHRLYNPDRFPCPQQKDSGNTFRAIDWDQGEAALVSKLGEIAAKGRNDRIVFLTEMTTGTLKDLMLLWLTQMGSPQGLVVYEPFAYEPLRKANHAVFGIDIIPTYRIDQADFLISFGAGFLETWLSNVEYARQFAEFHAVRDGEKQPFIFVGPRLSMTANNADLWIPVAPGDEYLIALGILGVILDEDLADALQPARKAFLRALVQPWPVAKVAAKTGAGMELIQNVARQFARARRPLALAEGLSFSVPNATETAVVANLLCSLKPETLRTLDFGAASAYSDAARTDRSKELAEKMRGGEVELLLINEANPVFSLPVSWDFRKSLERVPYVVSFSSAMDETSAFAHLCLPSNTPLESWGDYSPRVGVDGLMQPVMGTIFQTRPLGDLLISTGKKVIGEEKLPWKDFQDLLQESWQRRQKEVSPDVSFVSFWENAMKRGGVWGSAGSGTTEPSLQSFEFSFLSPQTVDKSEAGLHFTAYPTVQFFDGRQANRMWLQELPDPMTQTTWGGWLEIHLETAKVLGIEKGDIVQVTSPYGVLEVPALPIPTVPQGTLAMPVGQGHVNYGRFASGNPANPMDLLPSGVDTNSGGMLRPSFRVSVKRLDKIHPIAHTDGSFYQEGRHLFQTVSLTEYTEAIAAGRKPELDHPLPEGFDPKKDFYPPHEHKDYRWCMVVDLDRCIGCSACVVACYAENNLSVVGRAQVLKSRIMHWLRIQRYFEDEKPRAGWLPMLCQHCCCAPCESVCPVYAPHHSKEGLNNQVYNRCMGTRFCFQNDPYKVRRFNWFTFKHPSPLDWQLNPDVTVREKGVMEKCSFCVQRIIEAKIKARNEGRKVRDGDFTTACAQTCPADVFTFGNLLDPDSRVSRLIQDPRAYQVLMELNTKPAVIYLKRVSHSVEV